MTYMKFAKLALKSAEHGAWELLIFLFGPVTRIFNSRFSRKTVCMAEGVEGGGSRERQRQKDRQ